MVLPPGEQHDVGGGLWSLTAFLVIIITKEKIKAKLSHQGRGSGR